MSKKLILLVAIIALVASMPRIRTPNYNEEELIKCLKEKNIEYDDKIEELRGYYDLLRIYLFSKKIEEYKIDDEIKSHLIHCFENYGQKASRVSPYLNCLDRCKFERPGEQCSCPHY